MPSQWKNMEGQGPDGKTVRMPVFVFTEPQDPYLLCKMLKANYPNIFRQVHYEIEVANGAPTLDLSQVKG